jgi:tetratricopeptide (TPR) repeat protein
MKGMGMNCADVQEGDFLERYLLERLSDLERDAFEQHYFECSSCFSLLQTAVSAQAALSHLPPARRRAGAGLFHWRSAWTPAFATFVVVLAVGSWWYSARKQLLSKQVSKSANSTTPAPDQPGSPSSIAPSLEELASVEPPPYSAVVLRSGEDGAHETFRQAMQYYSTHDYANAIPGLEVAAKSSPQTATYIFYLGACYLLTGQADSAIKSFRKTLSIGDPGYSEWAHFYLAKAYLRKRDVSNAKDELQTTVRLHASKEADAEEILRQLRK